MACYYDVPLTHKHHTSIMPTMEDINDLVLQRIKTLKELRSLGINPYRNTYSVSDSSQDITDKYGQLTAEELENKKHNCSIAGRFIIIQLLSVVVPYLEKLSKEGESGRKQKEIVGEDS